MIINHFIRQTQCFRCWIELKVEARSSHFSRLRSCAAVTKCSISISRFYNVIRKIGRVFEVKKVGKFDSSGNCVVVVVKSNKFCRTILAKVSNSCRHTHFESVRKKKTSKLLRIHVRQFFCIP